MRKASDAAGWVRLARRIGASLTSDPEYLPLDPVNGALMVTGAGASPAATALRLVDGDSTAGEADVIGGRLSVATQHAQPLTDAQLAARDLATNAALVPLLVAIRDNADTVEALLAAIRDRPAGLTDAQLRAAPLATDTGLSAVLAAIRAEQQRRTDPLAAGSNIIGTALGYEAFYSSAAGGRMAYNASTRLIDAPPNSTTAVCVLHNPADSGVDMALSKLSLSQGGPGVWERFRMPAFTGGSLRPAVNRGGGTAVAKGRLLTGMVVTDPGTSSKHHHGAANTESIDRIALGIVLRPGQSVLWRFLNANTVAAASVALEPVWVERPAEP